MTGMVYLVMNLLEKFYSCFIIEVRDKLLFTRNHFTILFLLLLLIIN